MKKLIITFFIASIAFLNNCSAGKTVFVTIDLGVPVSQVNIAPVSYFNKIASEINNAVTTPLNAASGDLSVYIAVFEGSCTPDNLLATHLVVVPSNRIQANTTVVLEVPAGDNRIFLVYGAGILQSGEFGIDKIGFVPGVNLKAGNDTDITISMTANVIDMYAAFGQFSNPIWAGPDVLYGNAANAIWPEDYYEITFMSDYSVPQYGDLLFLGYGAGSSNRSINYPEGFSARPYSNVFNIGAQRIIRNNG